MIKITTLFCLFFSSICLAGGKPALPELETVAHVEIDKYLGKWYEIASIPQSFQRGCSNSTAEYSLRSDGDLRVLNSCLRNGEVSTADGRAWVVDKSSNAKLKVSFFGPFSGDYWIIRLGANYEYSVVGHPDRDYLWILSRTNTMDESLYLDILQKLKVQHYNIDLIQKSIQTN